MTFGSRLSAVSLLAATMALATAGPAAAAKPKGAYAGKVAGTGIGQKLTFTVAGGKVRGARARFTLTCAGPYETVTYKLKGTATVKRRAFRLRRKVVVKAKSGKVFRVTLTVAGRFNKAGTRAVGAIKGKGALVEPATVLPGGLTEPGETVACATPPGKQKFRVKRRR